MSLRPLGDRVLIRPLKNPDTTESGLHLVEHAKPEQLGTVVAVGTPTHPRKEEAEKTAEYINRHGYDKVAKLLRALVAREPAVAVGDDVLFSWQSGNEILVDDERYLLLRESDILAVLEPA